MNFRSDINVYEGYSSVVADGYKRSSLYLTMRDGCRIAIDVLKPSLEAIQLPGSRPTVVLGTGYRRAYVKKADEFNAPKYAKLTAHLPIGALITAYEQRPVCKELIHHGYNVVCVDFRGTGASYGQHASLVWQHGADMAEVVDWIAQQSWATDKVGMIGGSWEGIVQLTTAAFQPRNLTCIVPQIPPSTMNASFDGGLYLIGFARDWSMMRKGQDNTDYAAPVDGAEGELLFDQAQAEREAQYLDTPDLQGLYNMTRDQFAAGLRESAPELPFPELGLPGDVFEEAERISRCGAAIYLQTGWWDMTFAGACLDLYNALSCNKRIIVGPWNHGVLPTLEPLRWFDYWLKGVDNGIQKEPGLIFGTANHKGETVWKGSDQWPIKESGDHRYYLSKTPSGTIDAAFDGSLTGRVDQSESMLAYKLDYGIGMGDRNRMRFMLRSETMCNPDLVQRAERCLVFTGESLGEPIEITGHPAVFIRLSVDANIGAVHVTLEELASDGAVYHVTEGWLNLEHRKLAPVPDYHAGTIWHSHHSKDLLSVDPDRPLDVALELYPVSYQISKHSRLRLTFAANDCDNLYVPEHDAPSTWEFYLGGADAPKLMLPIEDVRARPADRILPGAFAGQDCGFAFERSSDTRD